MFQRILALVILSASIATMAVAHHDENHGETEIAAAIGPVLDAAAPEFSGLNSDGETVALADLAGTQGTILVFVRSADWCPFCKRQLIELSEISSSLDASGWQAVGLSYDTPEKLAAFSEQSDISFPLISDTGSATIKAFGLLNEEVNPESRAYGIPHPAIVFVDTSGNVKAVLREEGYRTRPSNEVILETVERLKVPAS